MTLLEFRRQVQKGMRVRNSTTCTLSQNVTVTMLRYRNTCSIHCYVWRPGVRGCHEGECCSCAEDWKCSGELILLERSFLCPQAFSWRVARMHNSIGPGWAASRPRCWAQVPLKTPRARMPHLRRILDHLAGSHANRFCNICILVNDPRRGSDVTCFAFKQAKSRSGGR